jgi:hypothetical protein
MMIWDVYGRKRVSVPIEEIEYLLHAFACDPEERYGMVLVDFMATTDRVVCMAKDPPFSWDELTRSCYPAKQIMAGIVLFEMGFRCLHRSDGQKELIYTLTQDCLDYCDGCCLVQVYRQLQVDEWLEVEW